MTSWRRIVVLALALVVALAACHRTRKTLVPDVPKTGSSIARTRFIDARAKFLRDGSGGEEFERIVEDYPEDPIAPWAQLYAGISAVATHRYEAAAASLEPILANREVDPGIRRRSELFLGIAYNYLGKVDKALPLLRQFTGSQEPAIENDAERTEYLAALAYATASVDPVASLPIFDQLYARVTPTERAMITARCQEVTAAADPAALEKVFGDLDKNGPAMAAVASRLAIAAAQAGNAEKAKAMREAAAPARRAVGLPSTIDIAIIPSGGGKAGLVGAVMPNRRSHASEAVQAGLGLASGAAGGEGVVAVEIRHARDPAAAAVAVDSLAKQDVVAIVGPLDGASVDAATVRADELGVPLLSLTSRPDQRKPSKYVFHVRHSAEARARTLARYALGKGVTTFAILSPEDNYGRSVGAAFADEVKKGGGTIVTTVTYPSGTKSFVKYAGRLSGTFVGLFVPDTANELALIAPAASASGKIPKPLGTKKLKAGRPIVLMSTAEGLTGLFVVQAERHAEGALLAPGYYPDDKAAEQKSFLDRFLAAFGRAPGANEAYAYDAAQLAAAAGAGGRAGLAATLAHGSLVGLTGTIRFDSDHRRADPGVLYTVVDESGVFAIRALR